MAWTYDRLDRLDDLKERIQTLQSYLRRAQCDATDPTAKARYNGRVAILARRFLRLSKHGRRLRALARGAV